MEITLQDSEQNQDHPYERQHPEIVILTFE